MKESIIENATKIRLNEYYFDDAALYMKIYVKIRTKICNEQHRLMGLSVAKANALLNFMCYNQSQNKRSSVFATTLHNRCVFSTLNCMRENTWTSLFLSMCACRVCMCFRLFISLCILLYSTLRRAATVNWNKYLNRCTQYWTSNIGFF